MGIHAGQTRRYLGSWRIIYMYVEGGNRTAETKVRGSEYICGRVSNFASRVSSLVQSAWILHVREGERQGARRER